MHKPLILLKFVPHVLHLPDVLIRQTLIVGVTERVMRESTLAKWYLDFLVQERRRMLGTALHPKTGLPLPALQFPNRRIANGYRLLLTRCYCKVRRAC